MMETTRQASPTYLEVCVKEMQKANKQVLFFKVASSNLEKIFANEKSTLS